MPIAVKPNPKANPSLNMDLNFSPELLHQQAVRQLQYSTTYKASKSDAFILAHKQALQMILEKVKNKSKLTIENINIINLLLIDQLELRRSDTRDFKIGTTRGTPNSDLENLKIQEMAVGLEFLNPSLVPQAMDVLLFNINKIDSNTTLKEIAKIYQDFVFIHPYLDGNGRTARVLLDYMLLKGGFNFTNHNINVSIILSQSIAELAAHLALNLN